MKRVWLIIIVIILLLAVGTLGYFLGSNNVVEPDKQEENLIPEKENNSDYQDVQETENEDEPVIINTSFANLENSIYEALGNGNVAKIIVDDFIFDGEKMDLYLDAIEDVYGFNIFLNGKELSMIGYGNIKIFDNKLLLVEYIAHTIGPNQIVQEYFNKNGDMIFELSEIQSYEWNNENTVMKYEVIDASWPGCEHVKCDELTEPSAIGFEEYEVKYDDGVFSEPVKIAEKRCSELCEK